MKKKQTSIVSQFFKTHVIDALSFMAMGLFCSLILGLIIKQIAMIPGLEFLASIAVLLQSAPVVGGSIGMAIGLGLKRAPLVTISAVAVGALGYQFGGPIGAYLASIVGLEAGSLVSKRTPVDIIVTPLVAVVAGGLFAKYCCAPINEWVMSLGEVINRAQTPCATKRRCLSTNWSKTAIPQVRLSSCRTKRVSCTPCWMPRAWIWASFPNG